MKITLLALVVLLQLSASHAKDSFYQWIDTQGVTHFTDDPDKIPKRYQKKSRKLKLSEEPARVPAPTPQPQPQAAEPPGLSSKVHTQLWWREQFSGLHSELKTLQEGLPAKQTRLAELKRKRAIFVRAQDREAVNKMQAEISADEARINDLRNQMDTLKRDAVRDLVPGEWLQ